MNGGKISNNINKYYNSGVHVDGMFIMNNGVIEKNGCRKGGGVYVEEGSFIMNDGTIKENFAYGSSGYSYGGGGIYIYSNATFTMNGGLIEDRAKFIWEWRKILENTENLSIWQDQVRELLVDEETRQVTGDPDDIACGKIHFFTIQDSAPLA